jgi:hypothetical protein
MDWTEAHLQGDLEAMQQVREEAIDAHALVRAALESAAKAADGYWGCNIDQLPGRAKP